jgi:hypothetical protein
MRYFTPWIVAAALLIAGCEAGETAGVEDPLVSTEGTIDWSVYHTTAEAHQILEELEARHPELVELEKIGESIYGQDLILAKVTNRETGPHAEKPAIYVDGGLHSRELTGSQVALYWMAYLLNHYGEDPRVTELLDTRTFYIHPKFNPDGSDLVLAENVFLRSTPRPVDTNEDGIPDSDPPEDLTGNGKILQMRVPDPEGRFVIDADDPRIVRERTEEDEGPFYSLMTEGVDRNGDGIINSDGLGGIDMNRNWPRNWERWHLQGGSGDFPLSEPETHAVAHFINAHRNISLILHGHTSGGFIFRLPSAMDPGEFNENDEALVIHLSDYYTEDTGRPIVPSATDPVVRRYGTLIQWAYSDHGIVGYVPEFSPPPEDWVPDYDDKGYVDEADWHRFNDEEFGGRYFYDWEPYDHPQLGEVEIGGWWRLYWGQNPPHDLLERELETQIPWYLYMAEQTPLLEVDDPVVQPAGAEGGEDEERFVVEVTVRNAGFLPTNVTERGLVGADPEVDDGVAEVTDRPLAPFQVARAPLVVLDVEGGEVVDGHHRRRIEHLAGDSPHSAGVSERERTVRFEVARHAPEASFEVTVHGEKGGTVRAGRRAFP